VIGFHREPAQEDQGHKRRPQAQGRKGHPRPLEGSHQGSAGGAGEDHRRERRHHHRADGGRPLARASGDLNGPGITADTGFLIALEKNKRRAQSAGEALATVELATVVDAIVMASAAQREDVVYTSDNKDLSRLRDQHFRGVRIMGV
jgi:hypothetical protein